MYKTFGSKAPTGIHFSPVKLNYCDFLKGFCGVFRCQKNTCQGQVKLLFKLCDGTMRYSCRRSHPGGDRRRLLDTDDHRHRDGGDGQVPHRGRERGRVRVHAVRRARQRSVPCFFCAKTHCGKLDFHSEKSQRELCVAKILENCSVFAEELSFSEKFQIFGHSVQNVELTRHNSTFSGLGPAIIASTTTPLFYFVRNMRWIKPWLCLRVSAPPTAPASLRLTSITKDSVTLAWEAPERDGGSALTGYIIEKRDPAHAGGWTTVGTVGAGVHNFQVRSPGRETRVGTG